MMLGLQASASRKNFDFVEHALRRRLDLQRRVEEPEQIRKRGTKTPRRSRSDSGPANP